MRRFVPVITLIIALFACNDDSETVLPLLKATGTQVSEGFSESAKAVVTFELDKPAAREVTFTISTADGTAKAGEDFIAVTESPVTIPAGESLAKVEIQIIGDEIMDFNRYFTVTAANVINATAGNTTAYITILDNDVYTPTADADGVITPNTYPKMTLVWSDEFDGTQLNTNFWTYERGAGGWGNNELQEYTNSADNVFLENGRLHIKAIKDGSKYTSGRIITNGKKEFKYGRIDIRAKMPAGKGIWPALWMLGNNISSVNWPSCGEIDIMEYLGHETNKVYGTAHYEDGGHKYQGNSYSLSAGNFNEKFHVFTLVWQENSMVWYVDYQKFYQFSRVGVPFNNSFFFIMNVAVGGNWPGNPDNTTVFPQTMVVDYVRVFQ